MADHGDDGYQSGEGHRTDTTFLNHLFLHKLPRLVTSNGVERKVESLLKVLMD